MDQLRHVSNNGILQPPAGWDQTQIECTPLTVTVLEDNGTKMVKSYWKPTAEELEWLASGAAVVLFVIGDGMPPVAIGVEVL